MSLSQARQRSRFRAQDNDESDYLIFERHFDQNRDGQQFNLSISDELNEKDSDEAANNNYIHYNRQRRNESSPTDDLGIIDLDNDEEGTQDDDLFDVDDDKLPVLKNIFPKKNRPNNGKSVAIGSRSQGGIMKIRPQGEPRYVSKKQRQESGRQKGKNAKKNKTILQKPNSAQRIRSKG